MGNNYAKPPFDNLEGVEIPSIVPGIVKKNVVLPKTCQEGGDAKNSDIDICALVDKLRDPAVVDYARLYLAFLKDQPSYVCFEGNTVASIKLRLALAGLPTSPELLLRIFIALHLSVGNSTFEAQNDLIAYKRHVTNQHMLRMQKVRECHQKFYC